MHASPLPILESAQRQMRLFRSTRWDRLCVLEPRLERLEQEVRDRSSRGERFSQAWASITQQLRELVGWRAFNNACSSQDDYDAAYKHLLAAWTNAGPLPDLPE